MGKGERTRKVEYVSLAAGGSGGSVKNWHHQHGVVGVACGQSVADGEKRTTGQDESVSLIDAWAQDGISHAQDQAVRQGSFKRPTLSGR